MRFSRNQWLTMTTTATVHFITGCCMSLQAPFYPAEAEKKGATATEYGFVFGSYELTGLIVSPFVGEIIEKFGVRPLLSGGMTVSSTALILFGLLDNINSRVLFIGLSIILRVIESLGAASASVSAFSLIGTAFPNNIATMFATLEIFYGAGLILGPAAGGVLYTIGGYPCPFITVGLLGIVNAVAILLFIPKTAKLPQQNQKYLIKSALKVPAIAYNSACKVMFVVSTGFYTALLEPHLRQFQLPAYLSSLFFIINGAVYAVVAPLFGRMLDGNTKPRTLIILGCICVISSFTIIGPAPFLPFHATILTCIIALVIQGFAYGAGSVATFVDMFRSARKAGFPDTVVTYGLISGLYMSSISLGAFIGPTVAGILYDLCGFRWATQFISGTFVILLIVVITYSVSTERRDKQDEFVRSAAEESASILGNNHRYVDYS